MSAESESENSPRSRASHAAYETTKILSQQSKLTKKHVQLVCWSKIRKQSFLGKGSFSEVYRVYVEIPELVDTTCAIKFLSPKITNAVNDENFDLAAIDLAMEADLLSRLNHDNIIKLHGIFDGDLRCSYNDSEKGFFLLLDLLEDTLPKRLERCRAKEKRKRRSCCTVSNAKTIERIENGALGIAKGLEYLHNNGVIFRDLKPHNVGFNREGNPVIFDFGFAREIHTLEKNEVAGSLRYMSPEMAFGQDPLLSSDVYSFGVLLFEICTLQKPFKQFTSRSDFTEHVLLCDYRPSLISIPSKAVRDLISSCWDQDQTKRPDMISAVKILRIEIALTENQIQAATTIKDYLLSIPTSSVSLSSTRRGTGRNFSWNVPSTENNITALATSTSQKRSSFGAEGLSSLTLNDDTSNGIINLNNNEEDNFVSELSLVEMNNQKRSTSSFRRNSRNRPSFGSRSSFNSNVSANSTSFNSGDGSIMSEFTLGQLRKPFRRPSFFKSSVSSTNSNNKGTK
jgi:serine/threonine protein kinase